MHVGICYGRACNVVDELNGIVVHRAETCNCWVKR